MLDAFNDMIGGLYHGDASAWQVDAILDWEDKVREAVRSARLAEAPKSATDVMSAGADNCRTWRVTCYSILRALQDGSGDAATERAEAEIEASKQEQLAAEATARAVTAENPDEAERARAAAAAHRDKAGACRVHAVFCMRWQVAFDEAHAAGSAMLANEVPRAVNVGEAVVNAGGAKEIPAEKSWAAPSRPAMAGRRA